MIKYFNSITVSKEDDIDNIDLSIDCMTIQTEYFNKYKTLAISDNDTTLVDIGEGIIKTTRVYTMSIFTLKH